MNLSWTIMPSYSQNNNLMKHKYEVKTPPRYQSISGYDRAIEGRV